MKSCSIFLHFLIFFIAASPPREGRAPLRPYRHVVGLLLNTLHQLTRLNTLTKAGGVAALRNDDALVIETDRICDYMVTEALKGRQLYRRG
ncbi:MAG: hypothetical protein IKR48_04140 [Kiritimatiellae bacterium]|nr:hypothetical protein [Kiritimatiellia bacterium]